MNRSLGMDVLFSGLKGRSDQGQLNLCPVIIPS